MPDIDISEAGVLKLLQKLQIHKAAGPDSIGPRFLKECSTAIAPILTQICKRSCESGDPEDWKPHMLPLLLKRVKNLTVHFTGQFR